MMQQPRSKMLPYCQTSCTSSSAVPNIRARKRHAKLVVCIFIHILLVSFPSIREEERLSLLLHIIYILLTLLSTGSVYIRLSVMRLEDGGSILESYRSIFT
jgi:hypothetical protein